MIAIITTRPHPISRALGRRIERAAQAIVPHASLAPMGGGSQGGRRVAVELPGQLDGQFETPRLRREVQAAMDAA